MNSVKSHVVAASQSTCQKRLVICEIYDINGQLIARESNRCKPGDEGCHRLKKSQDKENYSEESDCGWIHAEINAIESAKKNAKDAIPYRAILYGHNFICFACEKALNEFGVYKFNIIPEHYPEALNQYELKKRKDEE